ncbi:hypothetical protein [Pseudomonas triticicola]|uniref:hypothetical protein n=1 Tax=Pseudomonas triticicola TaxID=2842345 RepID=UPI003EBB0215
MQANRFMPGAVLISADNAEKTVPDELKPEQITPHALGDFGGALSWPIPLSLTEQSAVLNAIKIFKVAKGDKWAAGQSVLGYLNAIHPLTPEAMADPAQALHALVASAEGQALGLAVQTHLRGISTEVSINEYALAALQLDLDPPSTEHTHRNSVAGFDLASRQRWGKPISAISGQLRDYLVKERGCAPEVAGLGAYALLIRSAAVFLIKNIPDDVRYGGPAWFNLAVAASIIEAHTPGKVANMTFAQVMLDAQNVALVDSHVTRYAQTLALIDWGVVQGLVERQADATYTQAQLDTLNTSFDAQLVDRLNTPILLKSNFPSRKEIALAGLVKQFGKNYPFEKRVLEWDSSAKLLAHLAPVPAETLGPVGMYSLLDVAMMDGSWQWKTSDSLLKYRIHEINELDLRVRNTFNKEFKATLANLKEGARLKVRHLISALPLEDRENLEYGKLTFYQDKTFRLSTQFWGRNLQSTSTGLTLRVERGADKEVSIYYLDLAAGSISRKDSDPATETDRYDLHVRSIIYATAVFPVADPILAAKFERRLSQAWTVPVPVSYSSERTRAIADVFVEHLDYDSEDILKAAKGQTTYDGELAVVKARVDFLLNLIPFKSAISNFIDGKYIDGAIDLFLDVLGFVTAGVSAAAKLAQVVTRTASAISKALKAAKIIGMLVLGELNPLSAIVAGGQLLYKGLKHLGASTLRQFNKLPGAAPDYGFLIGLNKKHGPAAVGSFKVGADSFEGVGVLKDGKWYRYNNETHRLYGTPVEFRPRGAGGFSNAELGHLAVKSSSIAGLEANARGIFRSADGERFYIRNIDATGKEAIFRISNDFGLTGDITDVTIVDRVTNRAHGGRLRQVAPDQWQTLSLRGGNLPADAADFPAGAVVDETAAIAARTVHTSTNPLNQGSVFTRERLTNGLWDPRIEAVNNRQTAHLTGDWGQLSQVPYTFQRTGIHQALSTPELSRLSVTTGLMQPGKANYSAEIATQVRRKEGGADFFFVMERIKPADSLAAEINALKIHDPKVDLLPEQANAVRGYWAPQGGYVDIPIHPKWDEPDHLFTAEFGGCALVADQMDANRLRVRHVEGAKELAQYNGLAREEHGWGMSMSMEFHDYGLRIDDEGKADAILTGFAFMKYDRTARVWKLHFQSSQGAATLARHSSTKPAWGRWPDTLVALCSNSKVCKVVTRPVTTIAGASAG